MVLGCGRKEGLEKADPVTVLKDVRDKGNRRPCHWLNLLHIFRYNSGGTFYKGVFDTIWANVEILIIQCHLNLEKAISTVQWFLGDRICQSYTLEFSPFVKIKR